MSDPKLLNVLGPLAALYSDPAITEIMVDAPDRVLVERNGKLEDAPVYFESEAALRHVMQAALELSGFQFASGQTIGEARFSDATRILVIYPPTVSTGPCLVIRKWMPATMLTWEMLIEVGFITADAVDLLRRACQAHVNILVTGSAGSGKTTFTNLLTELIPAEERLVVVEEVRELQIRHARTVCLEAAAPVKTPMVDLLSTASKMFADWLIFGELNGPAVVRAIEIFGHGHTGLTTMHADSVEDALARLEMTCLRANLGLGLSQIRVMIASAIRLITFQEKLPMGRRKATQIVELSGIENDRYVLRPLFHYSSINQRLERTGMAPGWEV